MSPMRDQGETPVPGTRWWWAERDASGLVVHLTLVEVVGPAWMRAHLSARSVRSGRTYAVPISSLLPVGAFSDPVEVCDRCGRPRGNHNARHMFVARKATP